MVRLMTHLKVVLLICQVHQMNGFVHESINGGLKSCYHLRLSACNGVPLVLFRSLKCLSIVSKLEWSCHQGKPCSCRDILELQDVVAKSFNITCGHNGDIVLALLCIVASKQNNMGLSSIGTFITLWELRYQWNDVTIECKHCRACHGCKPEVQNGKRMTIHTNLVLVYLERGGQELVELGGNPTHVVLSEFRV